MSKERECARALRGIVGKSPFNTYLATVKEVSENEAVCTVKRVLDDMEIKDVKLNATITNNEGVVIRPKKDSAVLITSIDGANWFVSQYSDIEKITIDATDKIIFNGGNNNGLIQIDKLTQKLNELVNTFNGHTHPVPNGASSTPTTEAATFDKNFYEDINITH
jgi:hypothetical protein